MTMTKQELDYQYRLALLFLDTSYLVEAIDEAEYIRSVTALRCWYDLNAVSLETAVPLDVVPIERALGIADAANVVPFPARRERLRRDGESLQ